MFQISGIILVLLLFVVTSGKAPEPPLWETRLTIHTLVREDVFAGLLENDVERLTRAEQNIRLLLQQRPAEKAPLLGWQASATLYRAVLAHEDKRDDEYRQLYQRAIALFAEANHLDGEDVGVVAITGGSFVVLADRLPKEDQTGAWSRAYNAYQMLWKKQAPAVDKLPLHIRGELLAGLAQSSQRTGHTQEAAQFLDKIQTLLPNTPYASIAKQWKESPESVANTSITCRTCHESGRLTARLDSLR